jgi:hypothetical protein
MLDLFEVRHLGALAAEYIAERLKSGGSLGEAVLAATDLSTGVVLALLPRTLSDHQLVDFGSSILPRSVLKRTVVGDDEIAHWVESDIQEHATDPRTDGGLTTEVKLLSTGEAEIVEYETHDLYFWATAELGDFLSSLPTSLCLIQHWISEKDPSFGALANLGLRPVSINNDVYLVVYPQDEPGTLHDAIRSADTSWRSLLAVCAIPANSSALNTEAAAGSIAQSTRMIAVSAYDGEACLLWRKQ